MGWGNAIYRGGLLIYSLRGQMGDAEGFGAEALQGLSFALHTLCLCVDPSSAEIYLYIDISSMTGCLHGILVPLS